MANEIIRPTELPVRTDPVASEVTVSDNGSTVAGVSWTDGVNAAVPVSSQAEAEAGVNNTKRMTPLATKQAIDYQVPPKISAAIGALNLGSASQASVGDFATAAQGAKADSALQPTDIGDTVQSHGAFLDALAGMAPGSDGQVIAFDSNGDPVAMDAGAGDLIAANNLSDVSDKELAVGNLGLTKFKTVPLLLADEMMSYTADPGKVQVGPGDIIPAGGFRYEVVAYPSADYHVANANGVLMKVLPRDGCYNIKAFGAVGNNIADDTPPIQKAVDVAAADGGVALVPHGTFKTTSSIVLPTAGVLVGVNRNSAVLYATGQAYPVVTITGPQSVVMGLYLRGGSVGVQHTSGVANASQIINNRIQYNLIGIVLHTAFICDIVQNYIAFNRVGIVSGPQSFQVLVRNNVIDNNIGSSATWGGAGVLSYGSSGLVLVDNTIEGNRNEDVPIGPSTGVGFWAVGLAQRTLLRGNWMESNGTLEGSSDVILGRPAGAWVDDLVSKVVPPDFRSFFNSVSPAYGVFEIKGHHSLATYRGITVNLQGSSRLSVSIEDVLYVNVPGKFNKPVQLYGAGGCKVRIGGGLVFNSGSVGTDSQSMQGVKASYVYHEGNKPAYGSVTLDGEDLFTATLTTKQFLALPGATLNATSRVPSSGTATLENGAVKTLGFGPGVRTVADTGQIRVGESAIFDPVGDYVFAVLALGSNPGIRVTTPGGPGILPTQGADGRAVIYERTITNTEARFETGDYFGWFVMSKAQFDGSSIRGTARLVVSDIQMTEAVI